MADETVVTDESLEEVAGLANNIAFVAVELASVTMSDDHGKIQVLIKNWIETEHALSKMNVEESNTGETDETRQSMLQSEFTGQVRDLLVKTKAVSGVKVEFPGEPRGPAIRLYWDNCRSNSLGGGLIIPLP